MADPGSEGDVSGISVGPSPGIVGQAMADMTSFFSSRVLDPILEIGGKIYGGFEQTIAEYGADIAATIALPVTGWVDAALPGTPGSDLVRSIAKDSILGVSSFVADLPQHAVDLGLGNPFAGPLAERASDLRPFGWLQKGNIGNPDYININPKATPPSKRTGLSTQSGVIRKKKPFYNQRQYGSRVIRSKNKEVVIYH